MKEISSSERQRLYVMSVYERELRSKNYLRIAGVDEAGRGSLAGPVVAAACILPEDFLLADLNDSKQLSRKKRQELFEKLSHHSSVFFGIGTVDAAMIDRINILQATLLAMQQAVHNLCLLPDFVLIDGNQLPCLSLPQKGIVDGDTRSLSIAAASIIAKETRDRIMEEYDKIWPWFGFSQNKGYGTESHQKAIALYGPSEIHRRSFSPIKDLSMEEKEVDRNFSGGNL